MNKLFFLGIGSGYHKSEGNTSAYIKNNETLLLIDCGETVFKKVLEKDLVNDVKAIYVLITHMHSDHIGSLGGFVGFCYWKYKIKTMICFNDKEKIKSYLELLGLKEGESFDICDDTVETNFDVIPYLELGNIIYHDACLNDSKENPHTSLRVLSEIIPRSYRNQVYCMHIDGENFIEEARKLGFNIAELI